MGGAERRKETVKIKDNFMRVLLSDSTSVEFAMGLFALVQMNKAFNTVPDRVLAASVSFFGLLRLFGVLTGVIWLRLVIAYAATFMWIYFIAFVWMEAPVGYDVVSREWGIQYVPGGIAAALANIWIAWRLQTQHNLITKAGLNE
jgi:hypothetical protein